MKFDDEFTGSSIDLTKWQPDWLGPSNAAITKPVNSEEVECIDPAQSTVGNGVLTITAAQRGCNGYSYASGLLNSDRSFQFTYGFMEARMYLPGDSAGNIYDWPAFWADGTGQWPATGEIDVMEGLDGAAAWHYHWGSTTSAQQVGGYPSGNFTGWHTFGADWEPGKITFYYDGRNVGSVTNGVVGNPMYLIVNLGLKANPTVPSSVQVDYVRVWQH